MCRFHSQAKSINNNTHVLTDSSWEQVDENDDPRVEVCHEPLTKKNNKKSVSFGGEHFIQEIQRAAPQDIWWTNEEAETFRQQALNEALDLTEDREYIWALRFLHSKSKCTSDSAERQQAMEILMQHPQARGLEGNIRTAVGYKGQQKHASAVLQLAMESNCSAAAIRKVSKHTSKASCAFASFIAANFDAQEAQ